MISVASGPFQGLPHHHIAVIYADHPVGSTLGAAGPCRGLAAEERKTIKQKNARRGAAMSNSEPEISWRASEEIASWRRVLNQTAGDARPNLERASVELLRLAKIELGSKQTIVDELAALALTAGIDDDEAQRSAPNRAP